MRRAECGWCNDHAVIEALVVLSYALRKAFLGDVGVRLDGTNDVPGGCVSSWKREKLGCADLLNSPCCLATVEPQPFAVLESYSLPVTILR
jgi:hypothetical protein